MNIYAVTDMQESAGLVAYVAAESYDAATAIAAEHLKQRAGKLSALLQERGVDKKGLIAIE